MSSNGITVTDGFDADANDPTASPIHGTGKRFKDGAYYEFGEKVDERDRSYVVLDRQQGWQKLEEGCPPEYLIQPLGGPRPPRPHVDQADWPIGLSGRPEHPWRWTTYLRLLDVDTGELSTFWTNTIGGNLAVGLLSDQINEMRKVRPNAVPVVALELREMPTQYGSTKPRPHFALRGWRQRNDTGAPTLLAGPEQQTTATALEQFATETAEKKTVAATTTKPATGVSPKQTTTKRGVTRFDSPELKPIKEPSLEEILDDNLPDDLK